MSSITSRDMTVAAIALALGYFLFAPRASKPPIISLRSAVDSRKYINGVSVPRTT